MGFLARRSSNSTAPVVPIRKTRFFKTILQLALVVFVCFHFYSYSGHQKRRNLLISIEAEADTKFEEPLRVAPLKPDAAVIKRYQGSPENNWERIVDATSLNVDVSTLSPETANTESLNDVMDLLSRASMKNWYTPRIRLIVFGNDRMESLDRLLKSLKTAHYLNDIVDLDIYLDALAPAQNVTYLRDSFEWSFGTKTVHHRTVQAGLLTSVIESWYPTSEDEYAVFLEDDIEVSNQFYIWLKLTLLKYQYDDERIPNLFGISLYTPRVIETTHPRQNFPFNRTMISNGTMRSPFLLQLPCSWGALFFPQSWSEYQKYIAKRLELESQLSASSSIPTNLTKSELKQQITRYEIPYLRSNRWRKSWKKYFIEYIVHKGLVMLYPNMPNQTSFSTNHMEVGQHFSEKHRLQMRLRWSYQVPLLEENVGLKQWMALLPDGKLPEWRALPVLNVNHTVVEGGVEVLAQRSLDI